MAKFKAASAKKKATAKSFANAIPCLALIILGFALIMFLFYLVLRAGA
jgi:hypothetical protein